MNVNIIDRLSEQQVEELWQLYRLEFWSRDRQLEDVRQMLKHSDVIVALCQEVDGKLLGFARILTDFVYRAVIFDVIIESSYRDRGLGRKLMEAIVNHPRLTSIEYLSLFCLSDMIPFYQKFGFAELDIDLRLMLKKGNGQSIGSQRTVS